MEQLPKIVQQGLRGSAKPGVHPDPNLLSGFAEKSLPERERTQVLHHLAACAECRDVVALAMPEVEAARSPAPERSAWLSWPVLRWGALAACVVVVSAAVTLHYERRQSLELPVAGKLPAAPENSVSEQPREKVAADIAPAAPFQDRDLGAVAGKLAKPGEKVTDAGMASARTGMPAPQRLDQDVQELSKTKSADKLPGAVAPAPASAPPAVTASAGPGTMAPESKVRNGAVDYPAYASTETATIEGGAAMSRRAQSAKHTAKDESNANEARKEETAAAGGIGAASLGDRKADTLSAVTSQTAAITPAKRSATSAYTLALRWTLSADGTLQRSFDSGKTWQAIPVAGNLKFRALAANDSDIWAGGEAGALYHSSDAGQHWKQVKPVADGKVLATDIVTVEFSDPQHGKLTTSNRETWTTSDGGDSWQSH